MAARATGTAPWPYPSAFTTAHTAEGATTSQIWATLAVTAARSTSTQAGRSHPATRLTGDVTLGSSASHTMARRHGASSVTTSHEPLVKAPARPWPSKPESQPATRSGRSLATRPCEYPVRAARPCT